MKEFENKEFDQNQMKSSTESGGIETDKSPWSGLFIPIIMGFILQSIQFNFLMLQYILPFLGTVFIYLGIRDLRAENHWFRMAWRSAIGLLLVFGLTIIIQTTHLIVGTSGQPGVSIPSILGLLYILVLIVFFLTMRKGIQEFFAKANIIQSANPLFWVAIMLGVYFLGNLLSWSKGGGGFALILAMAAIGAYILAGIIIWGMAKDLDAAGVAAEHYPTYAPNRFGGGAFTAGIIGAMLVLVIGVSILENHPGVQGVPYDVPTANETRSALVKQGIPKDLITIIPNETLELLNSADGIQIQSEVLKPVNQKKSSGNLQSTTVFFHISSDTVSVLEYFKWSGAKAYWNDGFVIWGDGKPRILDSRLIYEDGGTLYETAIPRLYVGKKRVETLFGEAAYDGISGGVSFPFGTDNHRGYILAEFKNDERLPEDYIVFNYGHFAHPVRFPYDLPENMLTNGRKSPMTNEAAFIPIQN